MQLPLHEVSAIQVCAVVFKVKPSTQVVHIFGLEDEHVWQG
jgi:hypothetical protein